MFAGVRNLACCCTVSHGVSIRQFFIAETAEVEITVAILAASESASDKPLILIRPALTLVLTFIGLSFRPNEASILRTHVVLFALTAVAGTNGT